MLEIYDCTLREGEQANGACFTFENRVELCKKLDEFGVDYIELGWPYVSKEIFDSFKECLKKVKKARIVAFGSTSIKQDPLEDGNLRSLIECGAEYACIFGKTSPVHVKKQLGLTKDNNLNKIFESIKFLRDNDLRVFYDAEHYFDGFLEDKEYAIETLIKAIEGGAEAVILCDTNGGILPKQAKEIVKETVEKLKKHGLKTKIGVHFHDDAGLALANTLEVLDYVDLVQGTINGIGERIGNLNFSEFLPLYIKKLGKELRVDLKKLKEINEEAFRRAGIPIPEKRAYVGDTAFSHKGGIHINAIKKGASYEHESPEDFGNKRVILLNSLGGKSCVIAILEEFGYKVDPKDEKVREKIKMLLKEVREKEKGGYRLGALKAEQFLLIDKYFGDYFGNEKNVFRILEWKILSEKREKEENSYIALIVKVDEEILGKSMFIKGGPIDAAFKVLKKILSKKYREVKKLKLLNFEVSIACPKGEESSVRTEITFNEGDNGERFTVVGVSKNILGSSLEALEKGFLYFLKSKLLRKNYLKKSPLVSGKKENDRL